MQKAIKLIVKCSNLFLSLAFHSKWFSEKWNNLSKTFVCREDWLLFLFRISAKFVHCALGIIQIQIKQTFKNCITIRDSDNMNNPLSANSIASLRALAINTLTVETRAAFASSWFGACTTIWKFLFHTAASFITSTWVAGAFLSTALAFSAFHFRYC